MSSSKIIILLLSVLLLGLAACNAETPTAANTPAAGWLATPLSEAEMVKRVPELATRQSAVQAALTADPPVLLLPNLTEARSSRAGISPERHSFFRISL